jgi:hydroxyquinol 1,2-dioxygenase
LASLFFRYAKHTCNKGASLAVQVGQTVSYVTFWSGDCHLCHRLLGLNAAFFVKTYLWACLIFRCDALFLGAGVTSFDSVRAGDMTFVTTIKAEFLRVFSMIIKSQADITPSVLAELEGAENPRFKEIMGAAIRHLHEFAREVKLTEPEFQQACAVIASLGQASNASHNEVVLAAGSTGLSALVCLLNNGDQGTTETTANLLGPFWRPDAPLMPNGANIVRNTGVGADSMAGGRKLMVNASVIDIKGNAVVGAEIDVWHSSNEGFYENQDPLQADMNLRARFFTDEHGKFSFETIKPIGYPIPVNGPVGVFLKLQGRHNMRPAHIHFMIRKLGFKTQFSQVYSNDDPNLTTDVQFGVTQRLIGDYQLHNETPQPWYSLEYQFVIEAGESKTPKPPITAKSRTPRPNLEILVTRTGLDRRH